MLWATVLGAIGSTALEIIAPILLTIIGVAATRAIKAFEKRTGIDIDDKAERKVKSAITTALAAVLESGYSIKDHGVDDIVVNAVTDHVLGAGAKDSASRLGLDKSDIARLTKAAVRIARREADK